PVVVIRIALTVARARSVVAAIGVPLIALIGRALVDLVLRRERSAREKAVVRGRVRSAVRVPQPEVGRDGYGAVADPVISGAEIRAARAVAHRAERGIEEPDLAARRC